MKLLENFVKLLEIILMIDINEKSPKLSVISNFLMVPEEGLEPTHGCP